MKTILILLALLFTVSFADRDEDRYNIYEAVIKHQFPPKISQYKSNYLIFFKKTYYDTLEAIQILNSTHIDTGKSLLTYKKIDTNLIANYYRNDTDHKIVENKIESNLKITIVNEMSETRGNKSYGYLLFYQIGFNKNSSQALIGYNYSRNPNAGVYYYDILIKKNNKWIVTKNITSIKYFCRKNIIKGP